MKESFEIYSMPEHLLRKYSAERKLTPLDKLKLTAKITEQKTHSSLLQFADNKKYESLDV